MTTKSPLENRTDGKHAGERREGGRRHGGGNGSAIGECSEIWFKLDWIFFMKYKYPSFRCYVAPENVARVSFLVRAWISRGVS